MNPTDLTVAAVIHRDGRYLIVEEQAMRRIVLSQPGGHIEAGESPEQAVIREVQEETGCTVSCAELIGVYLWIHPQTRQQFLRLMYVADYLEHDETCLLDDTIVATHWLTRDELAEQHVRLRSPIVLRCLDDFEAGRRESDKVLSGMLPLQHNVDRVLARADLV